MHPLTIYRHELRIKAGLLPACLTGGPRPIITPAMKTSIKLLLDKRPWIYQDKIAGFLLDAYDVTVSQSAISWCLEQIKITRKKLKVEAAQRNTELRTQWQDNLQHFTIEQLICVDKSGRDKRTEDHTYGWSNEGSQAIVRRWLARRDRISSLPAYTIHGYIKVITFPGTCTREIFEE